MTKKNQKNNHIDHKFTFSDRGMVNLSSSIPLRGSISQKFPDITGDIAFSGSGGQRYTNETFIIRLP
ncbi:hypothetical protein G3N95_24875 [Paraburkholderia sp. Tr-20389]|uniref:hypothetical protein n=1 Tax=Paraburkholderia sp. Tr-20389 TaxID=2703903 RepID=UPI00197F950E|nr:hypothetical protein [Paraburkholderia sp. Tr-20389]MBN3756197.1 hypothetical protein [Paraburkholderia sp. Tr-20389]